MSESDYCELCDLPRSQCIHGQPPAPAPTTTPARRSTPAAPRPRRSAATSTATKPKVVTRSGARKWTGPDELAPHIITILENAGGALPTDDLLEALEETVADRLLPGDHQRTPEGDIRWRYTARRARQKLISEGLMEKGSPGVWQLA